MSLRVLNPNAEVLNKSAALHMNINAAKGLQDVLKTNLGPKGTIKMLVGGAGDIKLTKDGNTLLKEMQIQNPTAIMIARTAVAQDDISGDGTTSTVLFIGELMKQSERYIDEGLLLPKGAFCCARLEHEVLLLRIQNMFCPYQHPDMKRRAENCYVLTANVSLEYEKREKLVLAERCQVDERVRKIIELKNKVCSGNDNNFVVINQKGIDPPSLDLLARAGIIALRRAKRRKMERLEHVLGKEKYTFVENVKNPHSCTILIKGPNDHTIAQIKDAVRDGLRAVKNTIEDEAVIWGAGAFEVAARQYLINEVKKTVQGRAQLGVEAFADALLVVPKTLALTHKM
ncbi:hypothetical protein ACLB2K_013208 [Fragaria x ananassa]